jgi:hypothetical protein
MLLLKLSFDEGVTQIGSLKLSFDEGVTQIGSLDK